MTGVVRLILPILALSILCFAGCATSQVITNDATASIWANGQLIGHGKGEIDHFGMPETMRVQVRAPDGRGRDVIVKRRVTGFTALTGVLTYGVCFLLCWEYPETIVAMLPQPACPAPALPPPRETATPPAASAPSPP